MEIGLICSVWDSFSLSQHQNVVAVSGNHLISVDCSVLRAEGQPEPGLSEGRPGLCCLLPLAFWKRLQGFPFADRTQTVLLSLAFVARHCVMCMDISTLKAGCWLSYTPPSPTDTGE